MPTSVKSLQQYIGFVQFYRQYIPKLAEKLLPLYKLLQKDVKFALTQVHQDAIFDINENLARAAKLSLRVPLPDKQLVMMCDESENAAGHLLLIEDKHGDQRREQEDIRTSSIWVANIYRRPDVINNVRKGVPRDAFCLRRIRTQIVGSQKTHYCHDRQQSVNPLLPVKTHPTETVESLRPSTTVRFCACPRTKCGEPSCRLFVSARHQLRRQDSPETK